MRLQRPTILVRTAEVTSPPAACAYVSEPLFANYSDRLGGLLTMRLSILIGSTGLLALGMSGIAMAQEHAPQPQRPARGIHGPRSIDQELDHLTKDLELTAKQRKQIRPLLLEHHDRIQALLDRNPKVSRQDLAPQIHAISDDPPRDPMPPLTAHQKQLEKAMVERMHTGDRSRQPAPSTPPH